MSAPDLDRPVLSLAESEVASIDTSAGGLVIRLSAASIERDGPEGRGAPVAGYASGVVLALADVRFLERGEPLFGRLRSGVLRCRGQSVGSCPLPFAVEGPVELELAFAHGAALSVSASAFRAAFDGEPRIRESLAC